MNILYKIYELCPRCGTNTILKEPDDGKQIQKCFACSHGWDMMGNPLDGKEADEETRKLLRGGWSNLH